MSLRTRTENGQRVLVCDECDEKDREIAAWEARVKVLKEALGCLMSAAGNQGQDLNPEWVFKCARAALTPDAGPRLADTLFEAIKHGDAEHQRWLRSKLDEVLAPVEPAVHVVLKGRQGVRPEDFAEPYTETLPGEDWDTLEAPAEKPTVFPPEDAKTTDYCSRCGESPESGTHVVWGHNYVSPGKPSGGGE